ncbi:MAG: hypothetical protein O2857_25880 [Planctomycetota bacterium]|nr:hypothetical protein [Planctomycetota bacterium]
MTRARPLRVFFFVDKVIDIPDKESNNELNDSPPWVAKPVTPFQGWWSVPHPVSQGVALGFAHISDS